VNDSWNVTSRGQHVAKSTVQRDRRIHAPENREENVDQEISSTSALQEDSQRGQDDGEDDLADIAVQGVSYCTWQAVNVSSGKYGTYLAVKGILAI
jgi:hypothetical protein